MKKDRDEFSRRAFVKKGLVAAGNFVLAGGIKPIFAEVERPKSFYYINPLFCSHCSRCMDVCPKHCISINNNNEVYIIWWECMSSCPDVCGECMEICPMEAIACTMEC
ncbi:4Fe-4S binding protein [Desulfatibacillum alkenivorans]|uniref:4Fe-4S binding protein n=1 Tax=Desulfatibacillum alkenivorans TaxID=259354 RepID=UPI000936AA65